MTVKGQPKITCSTSNLDWYNRPPTAESAIRIIEVGYLHSVLAVHTVFRGCFDIIAANKKCLSVYFDKGAARFRAIIATADILIITKRLIGFKEYVNIRSPL